MSLPDLIAHYLATNYPSVLEPFVEAARIPYPDTSKPPNPDLRTLVQDYLSSQIVADLGDVALEDASMEMTSRDVVKLELSPEVRLTGLKRSIEGISAANLLTVGVERLPWRQFDLASAEYKSTYRDTIITSSVDKTLKLVDYNTGEVEGVLEPHKAAVLCFAVHPLNPRYIVTGSMDGTTILTDLITQQPLQTFRSNKFVVRVVFSSDGEYFATASYDHSIVIYKSTSTTSALAPEMDEDDAMVLDDGDDINLACDPLLRYEEVNRIKVNSNPEAVLFADGWLLYTLRSSHLLFYVKLGTWEKATKSFNPHPLDTHVSFSVLNLSLHPSGKVVACQTGDRGAERVLIYGINPDETERLACLWTGYDADDFVLPRMSWLPDGTGLITTTPNGYLNLISLTGEVRSTVKIHGGSGTGQTASAEVIRDCAVVKAGEDWEVVSVGYDREIRISR